MKLSDRDETRLRSAGYTHGVVNAARKALVDLTVGYTPAVTLYTGEYLGFIVAPLSEIFKYVAPEMEAAALAVVYSLIPPCKHRGDWVLETIEALSPDAFKVETYCLDCDVSLVATLPQEYLDAHASVKP